MFSGATKRLSNANFPPRALPASVTRTAGIDPDGVPDDRSSDARPQKVLIWYQTNAINTCLSTLEHTLYAIPVSLIWPAPQTQCHRSRFPHLRGTSPRRRPPLPVWSPIRASRGSPGPTLRPPRRLHKVHVTLMLTLGIGGWGGDNRIAGPDQMTYTHEATSEPTREYARPC